jgi:hypothetical protein
MIALLILSSAVPGRAWGEQAHRLVNAAAVENLPEPLRAYFRARKAYLVEHAIDPDLLARDDPEERPHHYTEADAYEPDPYSRFGKIFLVERRAPSSLELQHGDSAWQIERFTLGLERALRLHRWDEADRDALFVAHYACDLTQPLHTLINYDGQLTGQTGIHARFETELVRLLGSRWVFHPQPAVEEVNLRARIFREMFDSYSYGNPLFAADRIAVAGRSYQDAQYLPTFASLAGLLAQRRLEAAISFVSSLWYTAWVRAGKPELRSARTEARASASLACLRSGYEPGLFPRCLLAPWRFSDEAEENSPGHARGRGRQQPERTHRLSSRLASFKFLVRLGSKREGRLRGFS